MAGANESKPVGRAGATGALAAPEPNDGAAAKDPKPPPAPPNDNATAGAAEVPNPSVGAALAGAPTKPKPMLRAVEIVPDRAGKLGAAEAFEAQENDGADVAVAAPKVNDEAAAVDVDGPIPAVKFTPENNPFGAAASCGSAVPAGFFLRGLIIRRLASSSALGAACPASSASPSDVSSSTISPESVLYIVVPPRFIFVRARDQLHVNGGRAPTRRPSSHDRMQQTPR